MNKIIFCDKNKELVEKIRDLKINSVYFDFVVSNKDDVFECKKDYPNAKIVTASNSNFKASGGLDYVLENKYPEQWKDAKEFNWTNDLFFTITCDKNSKSNKKIIQRALVGVFAYRNRFDLILTGLGTAIVGLDLDIFCELLVDLEYANFSGANLYNANLYKANLENADLENANLRYVNLENANLENVNLYKVDLENANLENANLRYVNLRTANLRDVNLRNANLENTNLRDANLRDVNLDEKERIRLGYINQEKKIVYKKAQNKIIELELIKETPIFSINNHKCRTNKVKVISIDGNKTKGVTISSDYDKKFVYEVGKIIEVKDFNMQYNIESGSGINFFFNRKDAENYLM